MDVRVAGLCASTATTLSAGKSGRASDGVGDEADTVGGRVVTGADMQRDGV